MIVSLDSDSLPLNGSSSAFTSSLGNMRVTEAGELLNVAVTNYPEFPEKRLIVHLDSISTDGGASDASIENTKKKILIDLDSESLQCPPFSEETTTIQKVECTTTDNSDGKARIGDRVASPKRFSRRMLEGIRLRDIQLIVVGRGLALETLVQRRLAHGGRMCILWTDVLPNKVGNVSGTHSAFGAAIGKDPVIDCWDRDFIWQPPDASRIVCSDTDFVKFRAKFGSKTGVLKHRYKVGPDIMHLSSDQYYEILTNAAGMASGIRILQKGSDCIIWQVSGAVEKAGLEDKETCTDINCIDVSVLCEEAKALSIVSTRSFSVACAYCVVYCTMTHSLLCLTALPGVGSPYWMRVLFCLGMLPCAGCVPCHWLVGLTGQESNTLMKITCAIVCVVCWSIVAWMQFDIGDTRFHWPNFMVCAFGMSAYFAIVAPLYILRTRSSLKSKLQASGKRFAIKSHCIWSAVLVCCSLGTWQLLYVVAIGYVAIGRNHRVLAGLFLPCATTCVELGCTTIISHVYERFIFAARASKTSTAEVVGDQRDQLYFPIALTHSFSEGARLGSLMCSAILANDFSWISSLLFLFVVNVTVRVGLWRHMFLKLQFMFAGNIYYQPSVCSFLHDEAKFLFGYARFAGVVALGLARFIVLGGSVSHALISEHALGVVVLSFILEVIEDVFVGADCYFNQPWRRHYSERYNDYTPFDLKQVFAKDRRGVSWKETSMTLYGVREVSLLNTFSMLQAATTFTPYLLTLLLGSGYWYGHCDEPLSSEKLLLDAILWEVPLAC